MNSVNDVLKNGLSDKYGTNISITRGFLTSDDTLVGAVKFEDFAVVLSEGIRLINNSRLLRKWMDSHFPNGVVEVCYNTVILIVVVTESNTVILFLLKAMLF